MTYVNSQVSAGQMTATFATAPVIKYSACSRLAAGPSDNPSPELSVMTEPETRHKSTSACKDQCPISLHRTGQWYKKIHGRFYYFGIDKEEYHIRQGERIARSRMRLASPSFTKHSTLASHFTFRPSRAEISAKLQAVVA
jgi:hypothetical protein